jgi:hypothetical protein
MAARLEAAPFQTKIKFKVKGVGPFGFAQGKQGCPGHTNGPAFSNWEICALLSGFLSRIWLMLWRLGGRI